jgi:hypothetical protein
MRIAIQGIVQPLCQQSMDESATVGTCAGNILVQRRRAKQAAKQCCRQLLTGCQDVPRVRSTDKLKSYGAAKREMLPGMEPRQHRDLTNRAAPAPHPPAGPAPAEVQSPRSGATLALRVWSHCPTRPTTSAALVRARRPSRHADKRSSRAGEARHREGGLRAEGARSRSALVSPWPPDETSLMKLTAPDNGYFGALLHTLPQSRCATKATDKIDVSTEFY